MAWGVLGEVCSRKNFDNCMSGIAQESTVKSFIFVIRGFIGETATDSYIRDYIYFFQFCDIFEFLAVSGYDSVRLGVTRKQNALTRRVITDSDHQCDHYFSTESTDSGPKDHENIAFSCI